MSKTDVSLCKMCPLEGQFSVKLRQFGVRLRKKKKVCPFNFVITRFDCIHILQQKLIDELKQHKLFTGSDIFVNSKQFVLF